MKCTNQNQEESDAILSYAQDDILSLRMEWIMLRMTRGYSG
jgi:hypothetical protein